MFKNATITILCVGSLWTFSCLILRWTNFGPEKRKRSRHEADGDQRVSVVRYHSEAVYRVFELYFKVALAVLGGIAYVALRGDWSRDTSVVKALLTAGSWILWSAAATFSSVIFMHQKSKIERWQERFGWWEPLVWIEFPLIAVMFLIAAGVQFQLLPELLR